VTDVDQDFDILTQLFQSSEDAVVVCNVAEEIILFNGTASQLYGRVKSVKLADCPEMFGMHTAEGTRLLRKDELPMYRALHGETIRGFELLLRDRQHGTRHMAIDAYPIQKEGAIIGAIVKSRVTGEKKLTNR